MKKAIYVPVKSELLHIFKDRHILQKSCSASGGYDECPLSNTLWTNFYNGQGK